MSHLSLALLGTPKILHAGQVVKFRSRKEQALLIYLASESGLHSREKIIALLWPDSDEAQGRTTLRRTLADLRSRIEDANSQAHLIVERDMLGFDFSSDFVLDLHSIESTYSLAGGSSILHRTIGAGSSSMILQLQHAASVFRGPFLEGFSLNEATNFENWIGFQREIWHQRISLILDRLSRLLYDAGDLLSARETAAR
jgi:DNA-binding SARP family transcriptional activator